MKNIIKVGDIVKGWHDSSPEMDGVEWVVGRIFNSLGKVYVSPRNRPDWDTDMDNLTLVESRTPTHLKCMKYPGNIFTPGKLYEIVESGRDVMDNIIRNDWGELSYPGNGEWEVICEEENRKVVGYKLSKPEYKEAAEKIVGSNSSINWKDYKIFFTPNDNWYNKFKKAGVLDLWFEPVYEKHKPKLPTINGCEGKIKGSKLVYGSQKVDKESFKKILNELDLTQIKLNVNGEEITINRDELESIKTYLNA